MGKHLTLKIKNRAEFDTLINNKDIRISQSIVESILDNLHTNKRFIYVLEIEIGNEDSIIELTLSRDEFYTTLKKNLYIHELYELYEKCAEIKKAMDYLAENKNEKEFGILKGE
jgi:hypothetical protein